MDYNDIELYNMLEAVVKTLSAEFGMDLEHSAFERLTNTSFVAEFVIETQPNL